MKYEPKLNQETRDLIQHGIDNPESVELVPDAYYDDGRFMYSDLNINGKYIATWWHEDAYKASVEECLKHCLQSRLTPSGDGQLVTRKDGNPNKFFVFDNRHIQTPAQQALSQLRERLDGGAFA